MAENEFPKMVEDVVATLVDIYRHQGQSDIVEILESASARFELKDYDNYNGGTSTYALMLDIPVPLFASVESKLQTIEKGIYLKLGMICRDLSNDNIGKKIDPPQMEFKCDGFWTAIGPQEIGEGKSGEKIFGRTWVSRHESWSARSPQSFMLRRSNAEPIGPDPRIVYIQRSPALEFNLYKVGLTRRPAEVRAGELSSATGVPLPYGVLASWTVGDCTRIEREVHQRLAAFRINPRREFFCAELSQIVRTVNAVIEGILAV